jgi:drug/metabolite transporter (DMT)-like permease
MESLRTAVGAHPEHVGANRRLGYAAALGAGALAACIPVGGTLFLHDIDPLVTAGMTNLFAALVVLPLAGRPKFAREDHPRLLAIALLGAALAPSLYFFGLRGTTASEAAILVNAETVFTVTLAVTILRERATVVDLAAVAVVVAGAVALSFAREAAFDTAHIVANGIIVASTLVWASDNIISTGLARRNAPHAIAAWKNLTGAPLVIALALALGSSLAMTATHLAGMLLVGGLGIGISLVLFYTALRHIGAYRTSAIFGLQGAFGAVLGYTLVGERLAAGQLAGAAAMVGGVLLLAWSHRGQGPPPAGQPPPVPPVVPP